MTQYKQQEDALMSKGFWPVPSDWQRAASRHTAQQGHQSTKRNVASNPEPPVHDCGRMSTRAVRRVRLR
jgi:hypothetical protein